MMVRAVLLCLLTFLLLYDVAAQPRREDIYSDFVLYKKRQLLLKDLHENVVGKAFLAPLDSNTEYRYEAACRAIVQFMLDNDTTQLGITQLFVQYDSLQYDTKRAMLETVYGVYPDQYIQSIQLLLAKETNPLLFSIAAAYSLRYDTSKSNASTIRKRIREQFPNYINNTVLNELDKYLHNYTHYKAPAFNDLIELFRYQQTVKKKVIYSFQRHNRDYAGMAIVQNADGSFMRFADGRLMVFEQLARSASGLPYFIPDGNTPQGVYSIQGTAVTYNKLIGPTPNLQLIMPYERKWTTYFHLTDSVWSSANDALWSYLQLLPPSMRAIPSVTEAFYAGKLGRNSIIAHGTTIDPEYFRNKPWYPLTPTMGCLCAKELWNVSNGRLLVSDQFNLVSAFTATTGNRGYLYVIDIDDQKKAVSKGEVEKLVKEYEAKRLPVYRQ
ncbi:hypothetical protein FAM09_27995 [Niastella caeni]|uniref:Uncharacterized protein n=1 Tax=Niastella caeni TaxID=2569763 RepID=A0A4S8HD43_9BACT|nr:hypothetical protein [Niastella caeni]THU32029.1 hypothetical protein FAM09_27995 [Niastella caeni]